MNTIFRREMDLKELDQLNTLFGRKCTSAWCGPKNLLVSAIVSDHPRAGSHPNVHVLLMMDRQNGRYVEIDAWRVSEPEPDPQQSEDAYEMVYLDHVGGQICENEDRWSREFRRLSNYLEHVVCGDPDKVAEAAGHFVMPIIDELHVHPWPVNEWMAKIHCSTTFEQATPVTVTSASAMTIEDKLYTARAVDIGTRNPVTVETEAEVSSEDVIHVLVGIQRGWQLAQQLGLDGNESPTSHPIVIEEHGPNIVHPDRVQLSMESLRSLSSGERNRTYVAVAILIAMHFRMATASAPIDDLEALRLYGCSRHFVTQVLALIAGTEGP